MLLNATARRYYVKSFANKISEANLIALPVPKKSFVLKHLVDTHAKADIQKLSFVVWKITQTLCDFELPTLACVRNLSINKWCYLD